MKWITALLSYKTSNPVTISALARAGVSPSMLAFQDFYCLLITINAALYPRNTREANRNSGGLVVEVRQHFYFQIVIRF